MIQKDPSPWTKDNAAILAEFLETGTGELFIATLASLRPGLSTEADNVNSVALRAKFVQGFETCFNSILSLTVPPPDPRVQSNAEAYPDLDLPPDAPEWKKPESVKAP